MQNLSNTLKNNLIGQRVNTLADCWKIILKDGRTLGFTTHTRNIILTDEPTIIYKPTGFTPTAVQTTNQLSVSNQEAQLLIDNDDINVSDLETGLWNNAKVYMFKVDWTIPKTTTNIIKKLSGTIGEITRVKGMFTAEFRSDLQPLQGNTGDVVKANCSANLGDAKCGINLATYTFTSAIDTITDNGKFKITTLTNIDGYFNNGLLTFTSGENAGLSFEIKKWTLSTKEIELQLKTNFNIASGDTIQLIKGCNKSFDMCKADFSNAINFRGFPDVPGIDFLTSGKK